MHDSREICVTLVYMTNPNDPQNGYNSTGGAGDNPYGGNYGNQQFPQYGSEGESGQSGHADQSGYGQDQTQNYGQTQGYDQTQGYGTYESYNTYASQDSYGAGYVDPNASSQSGQPLVTNAGPLPVMDALAFGFKRVFTSQWHVYLGLALIPMLVALVGSILIAGPLVAAVMEDPENFVPGAGTFVSIALFVIIATLATMAFQIVLAKVALRDTAGEAPAWDKAFKDVPWGPGFLVYILVGLAFGVVALVAMIIPMLLIAFVSAPLGVFLVLLVGIGLIFLYPFTALIPLYAIDGRTSVTGAFSAAYNDIKPNYWRVFGALALVGLITGAASSITSGLSSLILTPVSVLVAVFVYRWISTRHEQPVQQDGYMSMY